VQLFLLTGKDFHYLNKFYLPISKPLIMKQYLIVAGIIFLAACNSGKKEDTNKEIIDTVSMPLPENTQVNTAPPPGAGKIDIETFGDIKIGQPHIKTIAAIGEPDKKSKAEEWAADGQMHQDWVYTSKGLALNMSFAKGSTDTTGYVFSITANSNCAFKTRANMGIGSTYAEVQEAYKRDIDAASTTKDQITVGSIYGGIIFSFKNEKVANIFLGAVAE
jgi:hypothetical protein